MCANYRPVTQSDRLLAFFGVERAIDAIPSDVWPTGQAPFIRRAEPGSQSLFEVHDGLFGLLPGFQAEIAAGRHTYNARSETVATKASFREAWKNGWRCIIPAEFFYEPNYESGKAVRWRIRREGGDPLGIAGIYRKWRHPDGREVYTFAMLTVNADDHPLLRRFHKPRDEKRMVVILDPDEYGDWLSCSLEEATWYFRQWKGPLEAFADPLPGRFNAPPPTAPPADPQAGLF
jgi:putative SOS response-associated peptidase YedK